MAGPQILGNLLIQRNSLLNQILSSANVSPTNQTKPLNSLFLSAPNMTAEVISFIETPEQSPCSGEPLHEGGQPNPVKHFNGPVMMADAVWALSPTALSLQSCV